MGIINRYLDIGMLDSLILIMKSVIEQPLSEEFYVKTFDLVQLEKLNKATEWQIKGEAFDLVFKICTRF